MKTIRLLYPDYMSGGLEQYFFWSSFNVTYFVSK